MKYLTEKSLGELLKKLFPNKDFIHDRIVPNSGTKRRPDYRNDELKLIVEFDGYRHYTTATKIYNERDKYNTYCSMGYKVVRIPYFVQPSREVIKHLFDKDVDIKQTYPQGFIDEKAMLPCDFCELGVEKFKEDLKRFNYIEKEILDSLEEKSKSIGDRKRVFPLSMIKPKPNE